LPSDFPCSGTFVGLTDNVAKSFFKEGYFLANRLAYLSKNGMDTIL
jgi:hypothetical protein